MVLNIEVKGKTFDTGTPPAFPLSLWPQSGFGAGKMHVLDKLPSGTSNSAAGHESNVNEPTIYIR